MTLRTSVILICISFQMQCHSKDLPISKKFMMPSSFEKDSGQRELLHTLRADGMVDKVVIKHGNDEDFPSKFTREAMDFSTKLIPQEELAQQVLLEAIKASEGDFKNARTPQQTQLRSTMTKERLVNAVAKVRNLNRELFEISSTESDSKSDLSRIIGKIGRRITLNDNFLPGKLTPEGLRCLGKINFINKTYFDRGINCEHKVNIKCHLTYITDYQSTPEEKCKTAYEKNCFIYFKPVPLLEKVKKCHIPTETKCDEGSDEGLEVCRDVYETLCETIFKEYDITEDEPNCKKVEELRCTKEPFDILHLPHKDGDRPFAEKERCEKWPVQKCNLERRKVRKIHPDTECKKMRRKICAPKSCRLVPGREVCEEEKRVLVQNIPEEDCTLQPHEHCKMESTLVPRLVPKKNCIRIPQEVCYNTKLNPKKKVVPIFTNWCYDPRELKQAINQ